MSQEPVLFERDKDVCIITLNRPEKRNAIDGPMGVSLRDAFAAFEDDEHLRVVVLTGTGEHFCSGADLTSIGHPERGPVVESSGSGPGPLGPTRMALSKPSIAAVSGYAVAGGLELSLMCDLRIAEQTAVFGVFCRRWGVPLIDGGTVRLPRIIGQGRALDMILTGRPVDATEALQMGLVNRIEAEGQALPAAVKLAHQIAAFPQACLKADRGSVYAQWDYELAEALCREGAAGYPIIEKESLAGGRRFAQGAGRHGSFDK